MVYKQTSHGAFGADLPALQKCPRCSDNDAHGGERTWHDAAQPPEGI